MDLKNEKKLNSKKIIASIFTCAVLALLIFSGPAQAFVLGLVIADGSNSNVDKGTLIDFTATLDIETADQYLPINSLMLNIGSKTCSFNIDGEIVSGCEGVVSITKTSGTYGGGYGYGYGYDNSYGYGYDYNFGYGFGYGYGYGTGETQLVYDITIDTDYFNIGTSYAFLKANIGEETFTSQPQKIIISTADDQEHATSQTTTIGENTTEIIIDESSGSVEEITIPSTINSGTAITLDLSSLLSGESITIPNNFTLTRQGTNNYVAELPNGTIITGTGWDGKLIMPTIKVNSGYSVSGGSVDVVIDLGAGIELNFSKAVKVTLGGMAGKNAGWVRGTGALTKITTICDSVANPTNINTISPRECYIDDGSDLVIWTYHFTEFAAYTPTSTTTTSDKNKDEGSSFGGVIKKSNPLEETPIDLTDDENAGEETQGTLSRMTGAVIGAVGSTTGIIAIVFVIGIAGTWGITRTIRKRKASKKN